METKEESKIENLLFKIYSMIFSKRLSNGDKTTMGKGTPSERIRLDFLDSWTGPLIQIGSEEEAIFDVVAVLDPTSKSAQKISAVLNVCVFIYITLGPEKYQCLLYQSLSHSSVGYDSGSS